MSSGHGTLLAGRRGSSPGAQLCLEQLITCSLLNICRAADTTLAAHDTLVFPKSNESGCLLGINIPTEGLGLSWQQREPPVPTGEQGMG